MAQRIKIKSGSSGAASLPLLTGEPAYSINDNRLYIGNGSSVVRVDAGSYTGECSTAATTAAKTVSCAGFILFPGVEVTVKFTVTNTAAVNKLTLKVGNTLAKPIRYRGTNLLSPSTLSKDRVYKFYYGGNNWELIGDLDIDTTVATELASHTDNSEIHITSTERTNWNGVVTDFDNLEIGGRNLISSLPSSWQQGSFAGGNLSIIAYNTRILITDIKVAPNTTYTFSMNEGYEIWVPEVDENKSGVARTSAVFWSNNTFTTTSNTEYLYVSVRKTGTAYNSTNPDDFLSPSDIPNIKLKLEKGTIPTDWSPAPEDVDASINLVQANLNTHTSNTSNPHSVTKEQVELGNVENTTLSTWAGSSYINTLGTISTGKWNATTIAVGKGGTGKTSIAFGKMLYASAANTYSELTTSAFGRGLLNAVSGTKVTGLNADQIDGYHAEGLWRTDNAGSKSYDWSAKNLTLAGSITGATTGAFSSNVTIGGTLGVTGKTTLPGGLFDSTNSAITFSYGVGITSGALTLSGKATMKTPYIDFFHYNGTGGYSRIIEKATKELSIYGGASADGKIKLESDTYVEKALYIGGANGAKIVFVPASGNTPAYLKLANYDDSVMHLVTTGGVTMYSQGVPSGGTGGGATVILNGETTEDPTFWAPTSAGSSLTTQFLKASGSGAPVWADFPTTWAWSALTGVPDTFAPSAHTHLWAHITDKPSTFTPSAHTLGSHSDVTISSIASGEILKWNGTKWINNTLAEAGISASSHSHSWTEITSKPPTFTPSTHSHSIAQVTGLQTALDGKVDDSQVLTNVPLNAKFTDTVYTHPSSHPISFITGLQTALNGKEPSFTKNTAFNKNFGTSAGTVAVGNDSRIINGQTAFDWGDHALAGYAAAATLSSHTGKTSNPHSVTKSQVGLGNVLNVASYSKTESDTNLTSAIDGIEIGGRNYAIGFSNEKVVALGTNQYFGIIPVKPNDYITVSFYVKSNVPYTGNLFLHQFHSVESPSGTQGRVSYQWLTSTIDSEYIYYEETIRIPNDSSIVSYTLGQRTPTGRVVYVKKVKLEKGTKATDWTPAPEDQVSDWDTTDVTSFSFIKNKPTQLSQFTDNIGVAIHIADKDNPHSVTKVQVGLGSVDNTADSAKNVLSATKLTTARKINGTSFNGTANITTANWGTARNISIGGTSKSVNGSANVTWATSEIAAQSAIQLAATRIIWGQSFNGTENISGAITGATTGSFSSTLSADRIVVTSTSNVKHLEFSRSDYNYITSKGHIGFITGGTGTSSANQQVWIHSNGNTKIGAGSSSVPAYTLDVNGTGRFSSNLSVGGTLGVTGKTTLSGKLDVIGSTTLAGGVGITSGALTLTANSTTKTPYVDFFHYGGTGGYSRIIEEVTKELSIYGGASADGKIKLKSDTYAEKAFYLGSAKFTFEEVGGVGFLKLAHSNDTTPMHLVTTGGQTMYSTGVPASGGGGGATILLNGVTYGEGSTANIFSPTGAGTPGYILKAADPSGLPEWENITELIPWGISGSLKMVSRSDHTHSAYASATHAHSISQIYNFPTSMPASDVYAWAKEAAKPAYSYSEISATPTALKNPYSITLQAAGTSLGSYDGSSAKTFNITYTNIGAAAASHSHSGYAAASHGHAMLSGLQINYTDSYSDTHNVLGYSGTSNYDITLGNDSYKTIINGSPIVLDPFISFTGLVKCTNGTLSIDSNTYLTGITKAMVNAVGCNADTVDSLHASSFLRSDAAISSDIVFAPINGVGITFWDNPKYKITVTHISDTVYGGRITGENSSDWNMYFQEYSGEEMIYNRGFVFQSDKTNKLMAIHPSGIISNVGMTFNSGTIKGAVIGNYGVCPTASSTAAKTVTIDGFRLATGVSVYIKFSNKITTGSSTTLNINGTGAKNISLPGQAYPGLLSSVYAGDVLNLVYDGTSYRVIWFAQYGS